jgi:colicin import membrane protein
MGNLFTYRKAFFMSLILHIVVIFLFAFEHSTSNPVLVNENQNVQGAEIEEHMSNLDEKEPIAAVTIDSSELQETIDKLKHQKLQKQQQELAHQKALEAQAALATQQRLLEQKKIVELKKQSADLAKMQEQKLAEERKHVQELAKQKILEQQKLDKIKKEQADLALQTAEKIKVQKALEQKQAQEATQEKARLLASALQKKAEDAAQSQARAQKQQELEAQKERLAGEVDKYKALILRAISEQWILPDNVDNSLSSQFRIRLAPNGSVIEVTLLRSSGDVILDRSAQSAIYKASPLPVPKDATTFDIFRDIRLTVKPVNARG